MSKKADSTTTTEEEIQCRKFDDQNQHGRGPADRTSHISDLHMLPAAR
jgi:hypothetical protein